MYSCRPYGTLALLSVNPALRYAACWARLFRPAGSRLRPFGLDHQPFGLGLMRPAEQCEGMESHPLAKNARGGWGTRRPVEQCERMKSHPLAKNGRAGWGTRHTNPAFHRRTKPGCPTHSRFSNEWETAKRTPNLTLSPHTRVKVSILPSRQGCCDNHRDDQQHRNYEDAAFRAGRASA